MRGPRSSRWFASKSSDRAAAPLVPPEQQYFLRENLRLRLLTARVALLSHDDGAFKSDVTAANAWIKQYFDMRAKPVQGVSATLTQLAATPMPSGTPGLVARASPPCAR